MFISLRQGQRRKVYLILTHLLIPPVDAVFTILQNSRLEQMQTLCSSCGIQVIAPEKLRVSFQQRKVSLRCTIFPDTKKKKSRLVAKNLNATLSKNREEKIPSKRKTIERCQQRPLVIIKWQLQHRTELSQITYAINDLIF